MALTEEGKNWIALHFGEEVVAGTFCYAESGIPYKDPKGIWQTGSTGDVVITLIFGHLVGSPTGPEGETYADMVAGNGGNEVVGDDANWVADNTPDYCYTPTAVETGSIRFITHPAGASITLDGVDLGVTTPATIHDLDLGVHSFVLTLEGYIEAAGSVTVLANTITTVDITIIEESRSIRSVAEVIATDIIIFVVGNSIFKARLKK